MLTYYVGFGPMIGGKLIPHHSAILTHRAGRWRRLGLAWIASARLRLDFYPRIAQKTPLLFFSSGAEMSKHEPPTVTGA